MPIVKHILTFNAGELSPWMDNRTDVEKYSAGCRVLENFLVRPQGGISKRPGFEYLGRVHAGATLAVLVEFEIQGEASILLVLGGGKAKFFKNGAPIQSGGSDLTLSIPWPDADLRLLRWKQINDTMFFVHPAHAPRRLSRTSDTVWDLAEFIQPGQQPFLDANVDERKKITVSFTATPAAWSAAGVSYPVGAVVTEGGKSWICRIANTSSATQIITANETKTVTGGSTPSVQNKAKYDYITIMGVQSWYSIPIWSEYVPNVAAVGQSVTLTSTFPAFAAGHVGSFWRHGVERGTWDYETTRIVHSSATGTNKVYSSVLDCRSRWTFITFGNWVGKYYVQASEDDGATWKELRAFQSTKTAPRNASAEGEVSVPTKIRIAFDGYLSDGTSGTPYAMLSVEGAFLNGIVKITAVTDAFTATAQVIEPVIGGASDMWAEGAWSSWQGFPRCIELHQNRLVLASTTRSTHTVWGSAVDDYGNFKRGTDADESYAHTVVIGQREPIVWLASDRALVIGSGIGEFVMRGENEDKAITPEFGVCTRQSSFGSHAGGTGAIQADAQTLFVEAGGRVVREMSYRYDSDRYEAGNLNLLADHLFDSEIVDCAIQRRPWQVIWFVAGGKLYSLTYERSQGVAAWQRHPTAATVLSVAAVRKNGEDEVWAAMDHGAGVLTVERLRVGGILSPADNGYWSDSCMAIPHPFNLTGNHLAGKTVIGWKADGTVIGPATLNSGFFTGITSGTVIVGLPYTAAVMPMTPEAGLQNGSSRTRECRIHAIVPNLYRARGGKMGETPTGTKFDRLKTGTTAFTGELEQDFDGRFGKTGDICLVSDEPLPFSVRSLALKLNFYGDAG